MSLTIELTPQEEARFADYARQRGLEPATLAKTLITAPLPPTNVEAAHIGGATLGERFGYLFGTVDDSPPDLSTNPKYMEDFGKDSGEPQPRLFATRVLSSR